MNDSPQDTRWSLVTLAKGDTPASRAALSELCDIYYVPVHALMKRKSASNNADDALDLAHAFFAGLLEKNSIAAADPALGRFRNYLFAAAEHFVRESEAKARRQKRGGTTPHISIDEISIGDPRAVSPDAEFDRAWAYALIDRALKTLAAEMEEKGKIEIFVALRPWLAGTADHGTQQETAAKLGIGETAVRVLIHRLRKRFREIVEHEAAQTLEPGADVATELRHLLDATRSG